MNSYHMFRCVMSARQNDRLARWVRNANPKSRIHGNIITDNQDGSCRAGHGGEGGEVGRTQLGRRFPIYPNWAHNVQIRPGDVKLFLVYLSFKCERFARGCNVWQCDMFRGGPVRRARWKMKTKRQTALRAASQEKLQGFIIHSMPVACLELFIHLHIWYLQFWNMCPCQLQRLGVFSLHASQQFLRPTLLSLW